MELSKSLRLHFFLANHIMIDLIITLASLISSSYSLSSSEHLNTSVPSSAWSFAGSTWYGSPTGAGSDAGACGYGDAVGRPPFSSMVSAGGPSLFSSGRGCGECYQVKCTSNAACSGQPVTMVITDSCPGCVNEKYHFDMSGTAFGAMANPGRQDELRYAGYLTVQFVRVKCYYPGHKLAFHVDPGSNTYYFAVVIEYLEGEGDLASVELRQAGTDSWLAMQQSRGADWQLNAGWVLEAPFSVRLTSSSQETVVAADVIPAGWKPGATYWYSK